MFHYKKCFAIFELHLKYLKNNKKKKKEKSEIKS